MLQPPHEAADLGTALDDARAAAERLRQLLARLPDDSGPASRPDRRSLDLSEREQSAMAKSGPKVKTITVAQILRWANAWRAEGGEWPGTKSGAVAGAGLSWLAVDRALNVGVRGLPGGDSLAKLLARERGRPDGRGPLADPLKRAEVRRLRAEGWTLQAIGERFGVSRQAVQVMLRRAAAGHKKPGRKSRK
jgi:hypothetical protein